MVMRGKVMAGDFGEGMVTMVLTATIIMGTTIY